MIVKRFSAFICFLFCALSVQASYGVDNAPLGVHDFRYRVFVGGVEVAELNSRYTITDTTYQIVSDIRGVGFLQSLLGIEGEFAGSGVREIDRIIPQQFTSKANWRGKETQASVTFHDGKVQSFDYSPEKSIFKPEDYPKDVLEDVVDPASVAFMLAEKMAQSGNCTLDVRVFTGRHRLDIAVVDAGVQPLPENDIVGQRENVRLCTVTATKVRPKDKKSKKDQPIVVKMYTVFDDLLPWPYPVLLDSTHKNINGKVWLASQSSDG